MKNVTYVLFCTSLFFNTIAPRTIFEEARTGNTDAIKERLYNGENCAEQDKDGNNALHIAAEQGHTEIIDMLTTEPTYPDYDSRWFWSWFGYAPQLPNKNEKNNNGDVPLHYAAAQGHIETTECLLQKGANPDITNKENLSPVFYAINKNKYQLIPLFIQRKLIQQTRNGDNVLHYAIKQNHVEIIDKLITNTDLANQINAQGKTVAMLAAEKSDPIILKILHSKGLNLNARGREGRQPIHSAAKAGSYETAKYLLENGVYVDSADAKGNTPCHIAVIENNKNVMELFLAYKANVKKCNNEGKNIFALAAQNHRYEIMKRLKQHPDIDINSRDHSGRTAFMNATINQDHTMMHDLIFYDADTNIIDNLGENPLHKISRMGDAQGLEILLQTNKELLNKVNLQGDSSLFIAIENGRLNIAKKLIYYGASLQQVNKNGETIYHQIAKNKDKDFLTEIMRILLPNTHILNKQTHEGLSAMHYAAAYNNPAAMEEFSKYGLSYTDVTKNGNTLAHTAAASNALVSLKYLKQHIPMMLQERNKDHHTPFIVAVEKGNLDAVTLLLCEHDILNRDIDMAISLARRHNHPHVVTFLEQKEIDRMNECIQLAHQPKKIITIEKQIDNLYKEITQKDGWFLINYAFYQPSQPKQYTSNELYYKTEAERTQIALEYINALNQALQRKMNLEKELSIIITKEHQDQLKKERKRLQEQAHAAEQQQILEEQNNEFKKIKEQHNELERIRKQKEINDARKAQEAELKNINNQKKELDNITQQKAELDYYAQQKAKVNAAKHAHALDEQQKYMSMHLHPSAPPMEEPQQAAPKQCIECASKVGAKPLPCVKCKKKIEGICAQCIKNHKGRCPQCWDIYSHGVEKRKGECCIETAACSQDKGVTVIPCDNCKKESASDRICPHCLDICIQKNKELNQPNKCPRCGKTTLDETLIQKVLAQK